MTMCCTTILGFSICIWLVFCIWDLYLAKCDTWSKLAGQYDSKKVCTISVGQMVWELLMFKVRCKNRDRVGAVAAGAVQAPILGWMKAHCKKYVNH